MRLLLVPCFVAAGFFLGLPVYGQLTPAENAGIGLFHPPVRLAAADGVIDHGAALAHCGPWVEDVDGDGLKDLIVGDFSGYFTVYRNEGTDKQPKYAKGEHLQAGGEDAKVPIY